MANKNDLSLRDFWNSYGVLGKFVMTLCGLGLSLFLGAGAYSVIVAISSYF